MDDFDEITSAASKEYLVSFHSLFICARADDQRSLPMTRRQDFAHVIPGATPDAVDLIKNCLT